MTSPNYSYMIESQKRQLELLRELSKEAATQLMLLTKAQSNNQVREVDSKGLVIPAKEKN